jgi:hypothetical protein
MVRSPHARGLLLERVSLIRPPLASHEPDRLQLPSRAYRKVGATAQTPVPFAQLSHFNTAVANGVSVQEPACSTSIASLPLTSRWIDSHQLLSSWFNRGLISLYSTSPLRSGSLENTVQAFYQNQR